MWQAQGTAVGCQGQPAQQGSWVGQPAHKILEAKVAIAVLEVKGDAAQVCQAHHAHHPLCPIHGLRSVQAPGQVLVPLVQQHPYHLPARPPGVLVTRDGAGIALDKTESMAPHDLVPG